MFSISPLLRTGEFYDKVYNFTHDIPFYEKYAKRIGGPILELCCGTGRIAIPLAARGYEIVGVDFAPLMLKSAREKIALGKDLDITLVKSDIRRLRLRRKFPLVILPFNALQDFYTHQDIDKVFQTVIAHLRRGGHFLLDVLNYDLAALGRGIPEYQPKFSFSMEDGRKVEIAQKMSYDAVKQCNRIMRRVDIDGNVSEHHLDQRVFFPEEIKSWLTHTGFRISKCFGDFNGSPLTASSPKQIFICRR